MMKDDTYSDVVGLLKSRREKFLKRWRAIVNDSLADFVEDCAKITLLDEAEYGQFFDAYVDDMMENTHSASHQFVIGLVRTKINDGFPLSTLELINAAFMAAAREVFRTAYPDAFNTRTEYLERLSQMVLNNEITLARHYEEYLSDLNAKLTDTAETLKRRNDALVEFLDLATHELQTPLWSILGFASKLQRKYHNRLDENGRHCLDRINANVSDMHQLIEDVTSVLMIDPDDMIKRSLSIRDLLLDSSSKIRREIDDRFRLELIDDISVIIKGDPRHLKQLFYQIMKNSALFTLEDAPGFVQVRCCSDGDFHLFFEDNGIGIEPKYRELVFKPTERLKEKETAGTGMGLAFAQRIVAAHGGKISIENGRLEGICVHIRFPLSIISKK